MMTLCNYGITPNPILCNCGIEFSLDENTPQSQAPSSSKEQTPRPKLQRKSSKDFDMYFRRHNHSYLWNYFQLDLFPTVHQMI